GYQGTAVRQHALSLTTTTCIYILMSSGWVVAAAVLIGLPLVSYTVEWLRRAPVAPARLSWAPTIPAAYLTVGGTRLRYSTAEQGCRRRGRVNRRDNRAPARRPASPVGASSRGGQSVRLRRRARDTAQLRDRQLALRAQRRADPRRHVYEAPPVPDRETHPRGGRLSAGRDAPGPGARDVRRR